MFPLTFQHRAGVSPYTSPFGLAETCVFDKQSPGPILCGLITEAPLFPKLRGHFAEFLNNTSPVGLRILFLSTCVGLRYGHLVYTSELFLPCAKHASLLIFQSLTTGSTIARLMPFASVLLLKYFGGHGISTVCASATPLGLTLAPD